VGEVIAAGTKESLGPAYGAIGRVRCAKKALAARFGWPLSVEALLAPRRVVGAVAVSSRGDVAAVAGRALAFERPVADGAGPRDPSSSHSGVAADAAEAGEAGALAFDAGAGSAAQALSEPGHVSTAGAIPAGDEGGAAAKGAGGRVVEAVLVSATAPDGRVATAERAGCCAWGSACGWAGAFGVNDAACGLSGGVDELPGDEDGKAEECVLVLRRGGVWHSIRALGRWG
jgi:hypothetical protein